MTLKLVTRAQWGARQPRRTGYLAATRGVKVHYVGDTVSTRLSTDHDMCVDKVRGIQGDHMTSNGWSDIGYSALVCPHGCVFVGRGPHVLPAANGPGLNSGHYAVCGLVGDKGLIQPSDAMLNGIRDAIQWLRDKGAAGNEIKGHRDGYSTSCPGAILYAWVKRGAPRPGGTTPPPPSTGGGSGGVKAPAFPGRILTQPPVMSGADVKQWQAQMHKRGWELTADGDYGPASEEACRGFQADKDLAVDGKVGPITWRMTWEAPVT